MLEQPKSEYAFAMALAGKLVCALVGSVERIEVCGSLRRRRALVGDIEIVYIPKIVPETIPESLFSETRLVNKTDRAIDDLIAAGILAKRQNVDGRESWGPKNKLARLVKTGGCRLLARLPAELRPGTL